MTDRRVLVRLRVTPCGGLERITYVFSLEQIDSAYSVSVVERNGLTRKQLRRRVTVSTALAQERLAELRQLTVPAFPVSPMVCDGEYIELTVEGECSSVTIGWWTIAPEGADGIANFADWLRATGLCSDEVADHENG